MINHKLLNQILDTLEINIPNDENSMNEFIYNINLYKDGFSANEYSFLMTIREYKDGFGSRLMHSYSKPIQELEIFIEICKTIGNNVLNRVLNKNSSKTIALKRLHQKSVLISSEIVYLIKGGYSSAALSRWRTLLETSIIALFLSLNDELLSERYLDYEVVDTKKEMNTYKENFALLGFEKISENEQIELDKKYNSILKKYGNNFKNDNGWAAEILSKSRPNLHDFMDYLDLKYIKPYYKFSNNYVHSGAKSLMYNLGYIDGVDSDDNTICSPSNIGFTDPAQLCMLSFFNSTISLLNINPSEEDLISILSLYNQIKYISQSFLKIEKNLVDDESKVKNL